MFDEVSRSFWEISLLNVKIIYKKITTPRISRLSHILQNVYLPKIITSATIQAPRVMYVDNNRFRRRVSFPRVFRRIPERFQFRRDVTLTWNGKDTRGMEKRIRRKNAKSPPAVEMLRSRMTSNIYRTSVDNFLRNRRISADRGIVLGNGLDLFRINELVIYSRVKL